MNNFVNSTVKPFLVFTILLLFSGCANSLFYFPNSNSYQTPVEFDLFYESVFFHSKDGTKLHGWFMPAQGKALGTVVHFHGNAQNITTHFKMVKWLPENGYNVFTFDYRGYGRSEGAAFRDGVFEDSVSAVRYVAGRDDVDKNRIFLLGQSLGGVNCILTAATSKDLKIRAVVIDSAFSSYNLIARDKIGLLPLLSWFKTPLSYMVVSDDLSAIDYVDKISPVPMLFIHGKKDRVVPLYHAEKLFEKAKEPKELIIIDNAKHIEAFSVFKETSIEKIISFFNENSG